MTDERSFGPPGASAGYSAADGDVRRSKVRPFAGGFDMGETPLWEKVWLGWWQGLPERRQDHRLFGLQQGRVRGGGGEAPRLRQVSATGASARPDRLAEARGGGTLRTA